MISTRIFQWLFLIFGLSICISYSSAKDVRVVCYYTNWSVYRPGTAKFSPQNINPYLCTHLIYAFGGFTKENTLKPFDKYQDIEKGGYAKFTGLKTYNKDLKTLLAIGGWNEASSRFSPMVANADRRKQLVKNSIKFLRQNNFDGLDLDWEYPAFREGGKSRDKENYAKLVQELREEFERESEKTGRTRLLLTMAVPAGIEYVNKGYDIPKLTKYLDWMNILSYDYHSAFEPAVNHHAPLYPLREATEYDYDADLNIDYTIKHYLELGADPSKLVMGVPTYGRSYTLFNPDANAIGDPADGPGEMGEATRENGYLAYYEICENVKSNGWSVVQPNDKAMGPYAFKENQWVGFDDENIARKKAEYVAENGLGGIMFWAIDNDDFRGSCHGKPYPLIEAAKEALIAASGLTDDNLISPPSKPTKSKSRLRSRPRTTQEPTTEKTEVPIKSNNSRRRNRIKSKANGRSDSDAKSKSRRNEAKKAETTSTYSSLKVITPAYTTPEPPATPDQGGAFKCEDEGFFPHPKDCKKYFWCLSGPGESGIVAHQFTCPAGLYFNKAADSCDYSQNVLCNKKLSKTTSTTEGKKIVETTTQRISTKAPTTRTTARTTTTTEEEYEDEYEYEDEEISDSKSDSEEDPKVIKELLDLIKKAGGIEELEKQLNIGHDEVKEGATTPSTRTKSIVEKFLTSRTNKNTSGNNKYTVINRNSRGPQNAGIEKEVNESINKKTDRKPQYTTISRKRPTQITEETDEDEAEVEQKEEKAISPKYTTIRRSKEGFNAEKRKTLDRNKILGEDDKETEDSNRREVTVHTTPQYVNIRRQRPSTTEQSSTSKYVSIRRSTTAESGREGETEEPTTSRSQVSESPITERTTSSLRYQTLNRQVTTTAQTTSSTTTATPEPTTTTQASSTEKDVTTESPEIPSTLSSKSVDFTTPSSTAETEEPTSSPSSSISPETTSLSISTEEPKVETTKSPVLSEPRPFSVEKKSTISTTHKPLRTNIRSTASPSKVSDTNVRSRFRLKTYPNKNIDNNKVEGVSDNSVELGNSSENTEVTKRPLRSKSRFTRPDNLKVEDTAASSKPAFRQRTRPLFTSSTQKTLSDKEQDEVQRKYRPLSLDDLSSLTAADIAIQKGNREGGFRRSRIRTTTESAEEEVSTTKRRTFDRNRISFAGKSTTELVTSTTEKISNDDKDISQFKIRRLNLEKNTSLNVASTTIVNDLREGGIRTAVTESAEEETPTTKRRIFERNRISSTERSTTEINNELIDQVKSGSDEIPLTKQDQNEVTPSSTESIRKPPKRTRKVLRRLRTSTSSPSVATITTHRGRPLSYASLNSDSLTTSEKSPSRTNILVVDSDSNEANLSDETIEEDENIKLAATNIRENSNINNGNAIYDIGFRKFKKADVVYDKTHYGKKFEDLTTTTTTESSSPRTRKIIRRLRPTEYNFQRESTTQRVEAKELDANTNEAARGRKIVRRLRPSSKSIFVKNYSTESSLAETEETVVKKNQTPQFFEKRRQFYNRNSSKVSKTPSFKRKPTTPKYESTSTSAIFNRYGDDPNDAETETTAFSRTTGYGNPENSTPKGTLRYIDIVRSTTLTTPTTISTDSDEGHEKLESEEHETFYTTTPHSSTINDASGEETSSTLSFEETTSLTDSEPNEIKGIGSENNLIQTTETQTEVNDTLSSISSETTETTALFTETSGLTSSFEELGAFTDVINKNQIVDSAYDTTTEIAGEYSTNNPSTEGDDTNFTDEVDITTPLITSSEVTTVSTTTTEYIRKSTLRSSRLRPTYQIRRSTSTTTTEIPQEKTSERTQKFFSRKKPSFRQKFTTEPTFFQRASSEKPRRRYPFSKYERFSTTALPAETDQIKTTEKIESINQKSSYFSKNSENSPIESKLEEKESTTEGPASSSSLLTNSFSKSSTTEIYQSNSESLQDSSSTIKSDVAEKQRLRNKSLFSKKRQMNIPLHSSVELKEEPTTEHYTTLYHIFAEPDVNENQTNLITNNDTHINTGGEIEPIVEINRIIEVHIKNGNGSNGGLEGEAKSIFDKIGAINRVTSIKVVDGNGTKIADLPLDQTSQRLAAVHDIIEQEKKDEARSEHRKDRKFDFSVKNSDGGVKNDVNPPEVIDGISHIKVLTPKPILTPEITTIALEALFSTTEKSKTFEENVLTTPGENELLDTDFSRFVNIRIIKPADGRSLDDITPADTPKVVKILQTDEDVTMKAKVVEVTPKNLDQTIRIAPIQVAMARTIADTPVIGIKKLNEKISNTPFRSTIDSGVQ